MRAPLSDLPVVFEGVHVAVREIAILDDISVVLAPGAPTLLVGPNGAGKTTLFNLVAGDLVPDAGTIRFKGADITALSPHRRSAAGIGRTSQIPRPFENLTVFENLLVGAVYGGRKSERAARRSASSAPTAPAKPRCSI